VALAIDTTRSSATNEKQRYLQTLLFSLGSALWIGVKLRQRVKATPLGVQQVPSM